MQHYFLQESQLMISQSPLDYFHDEEFSSFWSILVITGQLLLLESSALYLVEISFLKLSTACLAISI